MSDSGARSSLANSRRLELRLEANNVLNQVNYTNINTVVNAINYGLPISAGPMRTLTRSLEVPVLKQLMMLCWRRFFGADAAVPPVQSPTFSTTTNVVVVDVTVLDRNGKPVDNLTKDDFSAVRRRQTATLQSCELQRLESTCHSRHPAPRPAGVPAHAQAGARRRRHRRQHLSFRIAD